MALKKISPLLAVVPLVFVAACGSSSKSSSSGASSAPSASSSSSTQAAAPASMAGATSVVLTTKKHGKLGTILAAGSKNLTVYLFEADKSGMSACSGECAHAWPPVLGTGKASGGAVSSDLGTIKRSDGKTQVTYKGHPLYYFIKDKDDGDAYGEGSKAFGAGWYVLKPSGQKVDES
jgi:predicted lipoprotein with Yx(FWY)xxD motif